MREEGREPDPEIDISIDSAAPQNAGQGKAVGYAQGLGRQEEPTVGEALRVLQRGLLDIVRRLPVLIAQAQALPSRERLLQPEKAQAKAHLRTNKGNFRPTDPTAVGFHFKRRSGERFGDDWCNRRDRKSTRLNSSH